MPVKVSQHAFEGHWFGGYFLSDEKEPKSNGKWNWVDEEFSLMIRENFDSILRKRMSLAECYPNCPESEFTATESEMSFTDEVLTVRFASNSGEPRYRIDLSMVHVDRSLFLARGSITVFENGEIVGTWPALFTLDRGQFGE